MYEAQDGQICPAPLCCDGPFGRRIPEFSGVARRNLLFGAVRSTYLYTQKEAAIYFNCFTFNRQYWSNIRLLREQLHHQKTKAILARNPIVALMHELPQALVCVIVLHNRYQGPDTTFPGLTCHWPMSMHNYRRYYVRVWKYRMSMSLRLRCIPCGACRATTGRGQQATRNILMSTRSNLPTRFSNECGARDIQPLVARSTTRSPQPPPPAQGPAECLRRQRRVKCSGSRRSRRSAGAINTFFISTSSMELRQNNVKIRTFCLVVCVERPRDPLSSMVQDCIE